MDSYELNYGISMIENADGLYGNLRRPNGKAIPYIGWYWRDVCFDSEGYSFGIAPGLVGFMENNKWGYGYTRSTTPEEWTQIKQLLEAAIKQHCAHQYIQAEASLKALHHLIQAIPADPARPAYVF